MILEAIKFYSAQELKDFVNERPSITPETAQAITYQGEDVFLLWYWRPRYQSEERK